MESEFSSGMLGDCIYLETIGKADRVYKDSKRRRENLRAKQEYEVRNTIFENNIRLQRERKREIDFDL